GTPGRRATRSGNEGAPKQHALLGEAIEVRRLDDVAEGAGAIDRGVGPGDTPPVVGEDEEDIRARLRRSQPGTQEASETKQDDRGLHKGSSATLFRGYPLPSQERPQQGTQVFSHDL